MGWDMGIWETITAAAGQMPAMARFAVLAGLGLIIPPLCRRWRLPAVAGFLALGVLLGPEVLTMMPRHPVVAETLADIGKLLLMFFAGLEIDLGRFRRSARRATIFGGLTFAFPMVIGTAVGLAFGYGWVAGLLIGSLLASHTLVGYPIVQQQGLLTNEAVTVTIGATILTDVASMLVLAVIIPIHLSGFSGVGLAIQLVELALFVPVVIFGLGWLGRLGQRWLGTSREIEFGLMLLIVALAAMLAEAINLEGIVGAFMAGLAVNSAFRGNEAHKELEFFGNNFFIPIFFITIGLLIDLKAFFQVVMERPLLLVGIIGGLILAKYLAALSAQKTFGYSRDEGLMMWSLSMPQVAATLASALVGYQAVNAAGVRLLDLELINTVIVMVLVTAVLGPLITERVGRRMTADPVGTQAQR